MRVIHRHPIEKRQNVTVVRMPKGAEVLTFMAKNNELSLWALVETEAEPEDRKFCLVWTGREPPAGGRYVGTAQTYEESVPPGYGHPPEQVVIVWHLFEVGVAFNDTLPATRRS